MSEISSAVFPQLRGAVYAFCFLYKIQRAHPQLDLTARLSVGPPDVWI